MNYSTNILADSVADHGGRITTMEITFPRFVLDQITRHRVFSWSIESLRARPTELLLQEVQENPVIPEFSKRVKGMGVGDLLDADGQSQATQLWLDSRDHAVNSVMGLLDLDVDKSRMNQLLAPFLWSTAIVTGTEWQNFFALRTHKDASPEIQRIARLMRSGYENSEPVHVAMNDWHAPLATDYEMKAWDGVLKKACISAGRCGRGSYLAQHKEETPEESCLRSEKFALDGHWSPLEHPATPTANLFEKHGNFVGWKQFRKFFVDEAIFKPRKEDE